MWQQIKAKVYLLWYPCRAAASLNEAQHTCPEICALTAVWSIRHWTSDSRLSENASDLLWNRTTLYWKTENSRGSGFAHKSVDPYLFLMNAFNSVKYMQVWLDTTTTQAAHFVQTKLKLYSLKGIYLLRCLPAPTTYPFTLANEL